MNRASFPLFCPGKIFLKPTANLPLFLLVHLRKKILLNLLIQALKIHRLTAYLRKMGGVDFPEQD